MWNVKEGGGAKCLREMLGFVLRSLSQQYQLKGDNLDKKITLKYDSTLYHFNRRSHLGFRRTCPTNELATEAP